MSPSLTSIVSLRDGGSAAINAAAATPYHIPSMPADDASGRRDDSQDLQFDRVESTQASDTRAASPTVTCVVCRTPVGDEYYAVNGKPVCANCRERVVAAAAPPRSIAPLLTAGVFGVGAAIAGAAIYYAVIAIANLEIGIVAILIGYMVGWAVRKGSGGRGGRRFQILAVALTYWAVGLAYAPLAYKQLKRGDTPASADSPVASVTTPADSLGVRASGEQPVGARTGLVALGAVFLLVFALPVMTVFGSLPFGLISALIIFIGMRQAWTMTAPHVLQVSGPYRVGAGPAPATG